MTKYSSWPTSSTNQGQIAQSRLKAEIRARFSGLSGLSASDQKDAALAELLAGTPDAYNVKGYGATGDGVTDDTAAIQAALDAADGVGGVVFLPPGTYKISGDPGLSVASTVRMLGSNSQGTTLIDYTGAGTAIQIGVAADAEVATPLIRQQFEFAFFKLQSTTGTHGMKWYRATHLWMHDVFITGFTSHHLYADWCDENVTLERVRFMTSGGYSNVPVAAELVSCQQWSIRDCNFLQDRNIVLSGGSQGIVIGPNNNLITYSDYSILINGDAQNKTEAVETRAIDVFGNWFEAAPTVTGSGLSGACHIYAGNGAATVPGMKIHHNFMRSANQGASGTFRAIIVDRCSRSTISHNVHVSTGNVWDSEIIYIGANASDVTILDEQQASFPGGGLVLVTDLGTRTVIVGNNISAVTGRYSIGPILTVAGVLIKETTSFGATDTTPSVSGGNIFLSHASTQTLTDFDDGVAGQEITVISKAAVTFAFSGDLTGSSVSLVTASGDVTRWVCEDGTTWVLLGYVDVSVDNSAGA